MVLITLGALLGLGWLVYKVINAGARAAYFEQMAAGMTEDEATTSFNRSCALITSQLTAPYASHLSARDVQIEIERAVACMNRLNQLAGLEHGPRFRRSFRPQLLMSLKRASDVLA